MSALTEDQRWLLLHMGGHAIVRALCDPEGVTHLMQSCWGSSGHDSDIPGAPAWLYGWDTQSGVIRSNHQGGQRVQVKAAEISRYAKQIPAPIMAEMLECRSASTTHAIKNSRWCHCGNEADCLRRNEGDPYYGGRHHPTEAEDQAHLDEYWQIRDREDDVLTRALGFEYIDERVGQLELFEVA